MIFKDLIAAREDIQVETRKNRIDAWLAIFFLTLGTSVSFAQELGIRNMYLCTEFDVSARTCVGDPLAEGAAIDPSKTKRVFLYSEVSSDGAGSVTHIWIRPGEYELGDVPYAPDMDVRLPSGELVKDISLSLERKNPWTPIILAVGRPVVREIWDIMKVAVGAIIVKWYDSILDDEERKGNNALELDMPQRRDQFVVQPMITVVQLSVSQSPRYRTFSSKTLDPLVHFGNWQVMVVSDKGDILQSLRLVVGAEADS